MIGVRSWPALLTALKPHSASVLLHALGAAGLLLLTPLAAPDRAAVVPVQIVEIVQSQLPRAEMPSPRKPERKPAAEQVPVP